MSLPFSLKFTTGPKLSTPTDKDEVDVTIVIAHRGPAMGLWMTVQSCEADLRDSGLSYNFVIVPNGEEKWDMDQERVWHFISQGGHLRDVVKRPEPLSPPKARNYGAEQANGKYLFFFDNHCMVHPGYFKRAIGMMELYNIEMLHSTTVFYMGEKRHYHYELTLEKNFWGNTEKTEPPQYAVPYRIGVAGHGGFVVRRKTWNDLGGYWNGFVGYGGEEVYWDLNMWMMGREVWLDPQLIHYHYAGNRVYQRHYTDDFFKNMLMCANILGGQKRMDNLAQKFMGFTRSMRSDKSMFDLLSEARERSAQYAAQFQARAHKSLDDQLDWFRTNNIPH